MNAKKIVNLTKFLLAGALVLGMTACSSDDDITKGGNENKVNTYMTVSLTGNSLQRTATNGSKSTRQPGSAQENAINKLTIYLVKDGIVAKTQSFTSGLTNTTLTESGVETSGKITSAFKVPIGTYKIYVVANPGGTFSNVTDGTTKENDLKALTTTAPLTTSNYAVVDTTGTDDATKAANSSFLMTNAINYNGDETDIPSVTITAANTKANPAKAAPIHVDRMAVKIRMNAGMATQFDKINGSAINIRTYSGGSLTSQTLKINLTKYSLINTYNKANLYQTWNGTSADGFKEELMTPNYVSGYKDWTADFTNQKNVFSTRTADASNKISNFSDLEVVSEPNTDLGAASYCLENNSYSTFANDTKYTKNDVGVTGILFQAQAIDTTTSTPQTFYGYNGKYYKNLSDIQTEYPNVFRYYYNAGVQTDNGGTLADQLSNAAASTPANLRIKYGVMVYEGGKMYYTYYIKDKNYLEEQGAGNDNYYAIMRNSIYDLNVKGLKRIGDDIPFGWVPTNNTTPIDADNAYMEVELMVNQWVLNTYEFNL